MDNWNSGGYSFETDKSISDEDDEMAAFEAECARMLEQEHERRAKEEKAAEMAMAAEAARAVAMPDDSEPAEPESAPEPEPEPLPEPEPESVSEPEQAQSDKRKMAHHDELAAIMQAESNESMMHSSAAEPDNADHADHADIEEEEEYGDVENDNIPKWLRFLFTLLLLILGGIGVYVMVGMDYHSTIFDPLCFIEISVCLLTAVGLNTSLIPFRVGKEIIMRLAAYALFAYYVIYAADALFLKKLLAYGIDREHALAYAKSHINADVAEGLTAMGNSGMLGCALFVVPIAFMLLMLFKPFRNIVLYLLTIAVMFFAVGGLRILTLSGEFNLSQGCMAVTGAVAAYIVFVFPPLQRVLTNAGLILWEFDDEDDED